MEAGMTTEELPRCHVCGSRVRYPAERDGYSLCAHCGRDLTGPSPGMIRDDDELTPEESEREQAYWRERGEEATD
jgi:hypothetical protein